MTPEHFSYRPPCSEPDCPNPATLKVAAVWSDGRFRELKTYGLACAEHGRIEALDSNESTTSELLQAHLPGSHVVKAFNNIPARDIPKDGLPAGNANRRALPIAGNDAAAKQDAAAFLSSIGFDSVDLGPLSESWRVERDTPAYVRRTTADELRALTADVERVKQV